MNPKYLIIEADTIVGDANVQQAAEQIAESRITDLEVNAKGKLSIGVYRLVSTIEGKVEVSVVRESEK